jgi:hypothetical protein
MTSTPDAVHNPSSERLYALKRALAVQGVELRQDSQLCKAFIAGTLSDEYTAEVVAETCAVHKFLYTCTSYSAECHRVLPALAARLATPMGGYEYAWNYVITYEAPLIKAECIAQAGGVPVDKWPWQKTMDDELESQINES